MVRNVYFDNCKAILIFLVVLGHVIQPWISSSHFVQSLSLFIYSFHMPAFVLITGYFAKYIKNYPAKELKYLVLFVIFTILYCGPVENLWIDLLGPYRIMWYLMSLIFWYVLLQFFVRLRHPIITSILIAIIAGYFDQIGVVLSLSRTLVFFPFFLMGYYMDSEQFHPIKKPIAGMVLAVSFLMLSFFSTTIDGSWLSGASSYSSLGHTEWYAGFYRLGVYALAVIMGACFLSLVPKLKHFYTRIGRYTLYIYLFHGLVVKAIYSFI